MLMPRTRAACILAVFALVCIVWLVCSRQPADAQPATTQPSSPSSSPANRPETSTSPIAPSSNVDRPASPGGNSTAPLPGDWSQLFPGLVGTFVGALLALWAAVWLDRVSRRRTRASAQASHADHLRETLLLIERELEWNSREVDAILADLDSRLRTERAPMTDAWNAVGPEAMKAGGIAPASMSKAYALLGRCGRLLEQYASDLAQGGPGLRTARDQTLPRLRELVGETRAALEIARRQLEEGRRVSA